MYSIQQFLHPFALYCEVHKGSICPSPAIEEHGEEYLTGIKQLDTEQKENNR